MRVNLARTVSARSPRVGWHGTLSRVIAFAILAVLMQPLDNSAEAYRLDALRTKALNEAAIRRLPPTVPASPTGPAPRAPTADELDLAARERHAIEAWRVRQADCRAGTRSACD